MKEVKPLTTLRALAAFVVFMFHYAYVYSPESLGIAFPGEWVPFMPIWRQGAVGVSVFFVLSGFLISRIYYDRFAFSSSSLRLFFIKRIARIWPLFLVFAIIQHVYLVLKETPVSNDFLVTLSMTQGFFSELQHEGLPTAWSLTVEESFYVIAPLMFVILARFAPKGDKPGFLLTLKPALQRMVVIGLLIAFFISTGTAIVWLMRSMGWAWQGFMGSNFHMWHSTIFGRIPEFGLGIFVAFIHRGTNLAHYLRGNRATLLLVGSVLGICACMWGKDLVANQPGTSAQLITYALAYTIVILTGLTILALCVSGGVLHRLLSHPLAVYLGKISYGFYLIQLTVFMEPLVALTNQLGYFRLPVLLVLTNLVCALFYQMVEVPARKAIVGRWAQ